MTGETVVVVRPGERVDHLGDVVRDDWDNPVRTPVSGVGVSPRQPDQDEEPGRSPVVVGFVIYLTPQLSTPFDVPVEPGDRVLVRGRECEVDGIPADWLVSPLSNWRAGRVINVRLKEG